MTASYGVQLGTIRPEIRSAHGPDRPLWYVPSIIDPDLTCDATAVVAHTTRSCGEAPSRPHRQLLSRRAVSRRCYPFFERCAQRELPRTISQSAPGRIRTSGLRIRRPTALSAVLNRNFPRHSRATQRELSVVCSASACSDQPAVASTLPVMPVPSWVVLRDGPAVIV